MDDPEYTLEKLNGAVYALATSASPIQKRLHEAFMAGLYIIGEDDFPADLKAKFSWIDKQLTETKAPIAGTTEDGTVAFITSKLPVDQCEEIARKICDLAAELGDYIKYELEDEAV